MMHRECNISPPSTDEKAPGRSACLDELNRKVRIIKQAGIPGRTAIREEHSKGPDGPGRQAEGGLHA